MFVALTASIRWFFVWAIGFHIKGLGNPPPIYNIYWPSRHQWFTIFCSENRPTGALVVVTPQGANLVLTSHVPHGEGQVLVLHGLHIEADGWDGGHDLRRFLTSRLNVVATTCNFLICVSKMFKKTWGPFLFKTHISNYFHSQSAETASNQLADLPQLQLVQDGGLSCSV